jgi:hypothetical protein
MKNWQTNLLSIALVTVSLGATALAEDWTPLGQDNLSTWFIAPPINDQVRVKLVSKKNNEFMARQKVLYGVETFVIECKDRLIQRISLEQYGALGLLSRENTPLSPENELVGVDFLGPKEKAAFQWACSYRPPRMTSSSPYTPVQTSLPHYSSNSPYPLAADTKTHNQGSMQSEDVATEQAGSALLVLNYSTVAADADFPVRINAVSKIDMQTSYVYLVPSDLPHHNETLAEDRYLTYHNVGEMERTGANQGQLVFDAPDEPGSYDLRLFDRGKEISTVTFRVGRSYIKNLNIGAPPP